MVPLWTTSTQGRHKAMYALLAICQSPTYKISQDNLNPAPRVRQRIHRPGESSKPTLPPFAISSSSDEDIRSVAASWRTCLKLFADTCAADSRTFTMHGDSLELVSCGFLLFLHHLSHITLSMYHVWELPAGVSECGPLEFRPLLKQMISFEV